MAEVKPYKDKVKRLSWVLIKDRRALFVRAPGTPLFFDPGCWARRGRNDGEVLRDKLYKELKVMLKPPLTKLTSFKVQAFGKPEGTMFEMHIFLSRYIGEPHLTRYVEEMRYFTSADEFKELTTDGGWAYLQELKKTRSHIVTARDSQQNRGRFVCARKDLGYSQKRSTSELGEKG